MLSSIVHDEQDIFISMCLSLSVPSEVLSQELSKVYSFEGFSLYSESFNTILWECNAAVFSLFSRLNSYIYLWLQLVIPLDHSVSHQ